MKKTAVTSLLVAVVAYSPTAKAQNAEQIEIISVSANQICGEINTNGSSTQIKAAINANIDGVVSRLIDAGGGGNFSFDRNEFANVLQSDLAAELKDQRACRLHVFSSLVDRMFVKVDRSEKKVCRIASNGVERYQNVFEATQESGWRGGGYSPDRWCNDLVSIMRSQHPGSNVTILGHSERSESKCQPFNCPQYNYTCTVRVEADPLYLEKESSLCP